MTRVARELLCVEDNLGDLRLLQEALEILRLPHHLHIQALCDVSFRDEQGMVQEGRGVLEQLVAGAHKPSGFASMSDFAP